MVANETLLGIIDACDPRDRKDIGIRKALVAALGDILAHCTPEEEAGPAATDESGFAGFCMLKRNRRLTETCRECLLSEIPVGADAGDTAVVRDYDFTAAELNTLGRWYSGVSHVFPGARASLCTNHDAGYSQMRVYEGAHGNTPTVVIFKHRLEHKVIFSCLTTTGEMHGPFTKLSEITDPQLEAIELPADETAWRDRAGWQQILLARTVIHRHV
jgi:hypothetical protein